MEDATQDYPEKEKSSFIAKDLGDELSAPIVPKKGGISFGFESDENVERGNWSGKLDFFLSCLGYAVGFGNIWRFPYLAYKNGGGAFLIPYFIFLFIVGLPIFLMELSLGQFSSHGPLTCWSYAPLFKGLGVGMLLVATYYATYYNILISWAFWYMYASFTSKLPWTDCGDWSTPFCSYKLRDCLANDTLFDNGTCYENTTTVNGTFALELRGIYNSSLAASHGIESKVPAAEYLSYISVQDRLGNFENLGYMRWDMVLALVVSWILVYFCLIKGIKTSGKVVYFTSLFPYVVLLILFFRMFTLEGYATGIKYLVTPDFEKLKSATVWRDACVQIFFTLSASESGLIALASYNRFKTDVVRDSLLIPLCNCLTSVFASCIIFGYLGYLSVTSGIPIENLGDQGGSTLAFIVYPHALTLLPFPPLFSILFFLMLITLGLGSQFTLVEAIITGVVDQFSKTLRPYKTYVSLGITVLLCLLGLTMTTPGGAYMLTFIDTFAGGWNVMLISLLECVSVSYVYGVRRFCKDIQVMTGDVVAGCIPWSVFKYWWMICWAGLTPLLLLAIFIYSFIDVEPLTYGTYVYPFWSLVLGWLMTSSVVIGIVMTGVVQIVIQMSKGNSFLESMKILVRPTKYWGPALVKNRLKITYVPDFDNNPWENLERVPEVHVEFEPGNLPVVVKLEDDALDYQNAAYASSAAKIISLQD